MLYTVTQITLCGIAVGNPRTRVMTNEVTEAAAGWAAAYCGKFHQPEIIVDFDRVALEPAARNWLRNAVRAFRTVMPPECALTFSMRCGGDTCDDTCLDLCDELGIRLTVEFVARAQRNPSFIRRAASYPAAVVVDPGEDGGAVYAELRSLGVNTMDFVLPPGVNWDNRPARFATETPVADYLIAVFDEWWEENHPDVRIACFDKLLRLLTGSRVQEDSLSVDALATLEVDWDGGWGLADAFHARSDGFRRRPFSVEMDPVERVFQDPPFRLAAAAQENLAPACRQCGLRAICGGGALPTRFSQSRAFDNTSVFCADLAKVIDHVAGTCTRELASAG